jgi:hypothetical protein
LRPRFGFSVDVFLMERHMSLSLSGQTNAKPLWTIEERTAHSCNPIHKDFAQNATGGGLRGMIGLRESGGQKIGSRQAYGRYAIFQMAEVAVPYDVFAPS